MLDNGILPSEEICGGVRDYLSAETRRPLTDRVFVSAPEAVPFEINVDWYLNAGDASREVAISEAVSLAVAEYRAWQTESIGRDIDPGKLIEMVMAAGAGRVDMATLQPTAFVQLERSQVAQCANTVVTYKGQKDV
jgi:phage-related baseplate assembly protein